MKSIYYRKWKFKDRWKSKKQIDVQEEVDNQYTEKSNGNLHKEIDSFVRYIAL
jgi:hypothetical protein